MVSWCFSIADITNNNVSCKLDFDLTFVYVVPGRVHLATVKSADAVKSSVMVEWHERNICRGKEVIKSIKTERTLCY